VKKVAILQSNYIPWKGYFDMIAAVDEFILFDDMQYTKNDWRNRNRIKTPQGVQWLTVPVGHGIGRRIRDVTLTGGWQAIHWKTLFSNYRRAPCFDEIASWLQPMYLDAKYGYLSELNQCLIRAINAYLGVRTVISSSRDYELTGERSERVARLCKQAGGTEYITGPAAKSYLDERPFFEMGIRLSWFDYSGYPEYPQQWGPFEHEVSILDLLFNCGGNSPSFMKHVRG
jgi:WbqC-like protein family